MLSEFLEAEMTGFADWVRDEYGDDPIHTDKLLELFSEPVYDESNKEVGRLSADIDYFVESSDPTSYEILPFTSLNGRVIALRVKFDWLKFTGKNSKLLLYILNWLM